MRRAVPVELEAEVGRRVCRGGDNYKSVIWIGEVELLE
jgi:hypothetical protein